MGNLQLNALYGWLIKKESYLLDISGISHKEEELVKNPLQ